MYTNFRRITASKISMPELSNIEDIKNQIAKAFQVIDEVVEIYLEIFHYELRVSILLNIKTYDDELMDKLLDIEYKFVDKDYGDFLFDFHYIPNLTNIKGTILHPGTTLVFKR